MHYGERSKIDTFKATHIDSRFAIARWIGSLAKRVNATLGAEVMLDGLRAECVGGKAFFGREQA